MRRPCKFNPTSSAAESLAAYGSEALADQQILEILLDSSASAAASILEASGGLADLMRMSFADLEILRGLSPAEAARVAILPEVLRRSSRQVGAPITSPRLAGEYLLPRAAGLTEEHFGLLCLDAKGHVIADRTISRGTATATLVSPREFFRAALRHAAVSALAWHNHPSGDPNPSREDGLLTKRLRSAGETIGIPLADHLVLGRDSWHSFRASEGWDHP